MNRIIQTLKHFFIPHQHNNYTPHFFQEVSVTFIAIIAIVLFSISASTHLYIKSSDMMATVLPAVLVDLTNDARISRSEHALSRNPTLDAVAKLKAEDMVRLGYFAHTSPEGRTPWYWFEKAGYTFSYAGENLALNFTESVNVEDAWLNSPTHKANILNNKFTEIGVATIDAIYEGQPTTFVVQAFGTPAITKTVTTKVIKPTSIVKTITQTSPSDTNTVVPIPTPITTAVLGAEAKNEPLVTKVNNLVTIDTTKDFIAVKNNDTYTPGEAVPSPVQYSSWYQKYMFLIPTYTDTIYKVFMWSMLIALLIMMIVEIRIQHPKNIIYGILLFVIILCLVYLNKSMIIIV